MRPCTAAFLPPPPPPPSADIKGRRIALNGRYTPEYHTSNSVIPAAYKVAEIQHDYHNSDSEVIISNNNVADSAAMDVRLRGYDGISFANFYKQKQMELFSALDNAFAAKAENALADYDSIKSAQVRLQSELGGRQAQLGIDVIGAISERADRAVGWQMHIYVADGEDKGASGGLFYRRIQNEVLYGVNVFADYEKHEYGDFYRYGVGGEIQNRYVGFAANYYIPLTEEQRINSTLVAFSREGYDANLQIAIPGASFAKAEAAYYYYDGKGGTEEEKGFRYGAALSPGGGIILKVFYDDGGEEFGGEISYRHTFGEVRQVQDAPSVLEADLFAPVKREHSQRIAVMTVGGGLPFRYLQAGNANRGAFTVGVPGVVGTVAIIGGGIVGGFPSGSGFMFDGNNISVVLFSASASGETIQPITITSVAQTITTTLSITARDVPINAEPMIAPGERGLFLVGGANVIVANLAVMGGYATAAYSSTVMQSGNNFALSGNGELEFSDTGASTLAATIVYDDDNEHTAPFSLIITATAVATISATLDIASQGFLVSTKGTVGILSANGGLGAHIFALSQPPGGFVLESNTVLAFSVNAERTETAMITVDDGINLTPPIVIPIMVSAFAAVVLQADRRYVVGVQATAATVVLPGGSIAGVPAGFAVAAGSLVLYTAPAVGTQVQSLVITSAAQTITTTLRLTAFAGLVGNIALDSGGGGFQTDTSPGIQVRTLGILSHSGGEGTRNVSIARPAGQGFILMMGNTIVFDVGVPITALATIIVDDDSPLTPPVSIAITATANSPVGASFVPGDHVGAVIRGTVAVWELFGSGGSGANYTYSKLGTNADWRFAVVGSPSLFFGSNNRVGSNVTIVVDDDRPYTDAATLNFFETVRFDVGARTASVFFTIQIPSSGGQLIATTAIRYLVTLPPDTGARPFVITTRTNLRARYSGQNVVAARVIRTFDYPSFITPPAAGSTITFGNRTQTYTLTIRLSDAQFIAGAIGNENRLPSFTPAQFNIPPLAVRLLPPPFRKEPERQKETAMLSPAVIPAQKRINTAQSAKLLTRPSFPPTRE